MARVRPFRGWRYARPELDLSDLTAPPYDVISSADRSELLAKSLHNVVALELPDGALDPALPNNRYEQGATTLNEWREAGILAQDELPAVYVLEQRFEIQGRPIRRRAFIAAVALEPFEAGVVIPHERTLPKALGDRFELIKATRANLSQVFGMFDDAEGATDSLFDAACATQPVAIAVDRDGVQSTLWAVSDSQFAERLTEFMDDRRIFIADGHHRYTTALAHRDLRRAQAHEQGAEHTDPAYDHVMMALVNMDDPELVVLPYHRMASAEVEFSSDAFYDRLGTQFDLSTVPAGHPSGALDGHDRPAFLIKTRDDERPRLAILKSDVDLNDAISAEHSPAWKSLDVAVLQELILWPLLGVHPDRPETLERMSFSKDAHAVFAATDTHDVAFVLRPTRLDQLREVSLGGECMPQKSTYFYPKLLSGMVIRSAE